MSFEESLIVHASPTLASIKVANLYNFKFESIDECLKSIKYFNSMMNPKGIYIELLKNEGDFYLIYVYRESQLLKELNDCKIQSFLKDYGYDKAAKLDSYLKMLKKRINEEADFPHEIGVFLGYPLDDVKSFIEKKGKNCIACGEWKVYHDAQAANCLFCKYKRCKDVYISVYGAGRKFSDMLVSA